MALSPAITNSTDHLHTKAKSLDKPSSGNGQVNILDVIQIVLLSKHESGIEGVIHLLI